MILACDSEAVESTATLGTLGSFGDVCPRIATSATAIAMALVAQYAHPRNVREERVVGSPVLSTGVTTAQPEDCRAES